MNNLVPTCYNCGKRILPKDIEYVRGLNPDGAYKCPTCEGEYD